MSKSPMSLNDFITRAIKVHDNIYDYSKAEYKNKRTKITIICPIHGDFEQIAGNHLQGNGCLKCFKELKAGKHLLLSTEEFIEKSNLVHNFKYDYSKVMYKNNRTKVLISCPVHNEFEQQPAEHLRGSGCQKCNSSKGELIIRQYLQTNNILFEEQKIFNDCIGAKNNKLRFDFYLSDYKICIEFDGEQHYKPLSHWGGEEGLIKQKQKDVIKTEYCKNNGIELLRIPYWKRSNINIILFNHLNKSEK